MAEYDGSITLSVGIDDGNVIKNLKTQMKEVGKAFGNNGSYISKALSDGNSRAAELAVNFQNLNSQIAEQTKKVELLKNKLDELQSGKGNASNPKIEKLKSDLEKTRAEIKKTDAETTSLLERIQMIEDSAFRLPETNEPVLTGSQQKDVDALYSKYDALSQKLRESKDRARDLEISLKRATGAATQAEMLKTTEQLNKANAALSSMRVNAAKTGVQLKASMKKASKPISEVKNRLKETAFVFGTMGRRIFGLAKSALVFSVITRGLTALRESIGKVLKSSDQFNQALSRLKAALWTLAAPIYNYVIPALTKLVNFLTSVVMTVINTINSLLGKSTSEQIDQAKALQKTTTAYGSMANEVKKTNKQLAAFDELNILSGSQDAEGSAGSDNSDDSVKPDFDSLADGDFDTSWLDKFKEKLAPIAVLAASIGTALLAWKISDSLTNGISLLSGSLASFIGLITAIAGAILLVTGYSDAWINGLDWTNFSLIMGGLALLITGIALAISPMAAVFAAIGGAIALIVLGVKDFIENGESFQNILMILTGLVVLFAAALIAANLPIAIIVTTIAAVTAAFVILWNKSEGFRNFWIDLWEKIKLTVYQIWNEYLKPTLKSIGDFFVYVYEKYISPTIDFVIEQLLALWNDHIKPLWNDHVKPMIKIIGEKIQELWNSVISPIIKSIGDILQWLWNYILKPLVNFIIDVFVSAFKNGFEFICDIFGTTVDWIGGQIDAIVQIFSGIIDFIVGVFTNDWGKAWEGVQDIFKGIVNSVISTFESFVNFIIDGINLLVRAVNKISFDIPDWVPVIGGGTWGFDIPEISKLQIPRLARGAVIPPNSEFLTILGDQKKGLNIETPLDTMIEAFKTAFAETGSTSKSTVVVLELDGREFGRAVVKAGNEETMRIGTRLVVT